MIGINLRYNRVQMATLVIALAFVANACGLESIESLLPPGALPGPTAAGTISLAEDASLGEANIAMTPTNQNSLSVFFILGDWRCHMQPNAEADTLIFLHDGEQVHIIGRPSDYPEWAYVQAGKKQCYVREDALE